MRLKGEEIRDGILKGMDRMGMCERERDYFSGCLK